MVSERIPDVSRAVPRRGPHPWTDEQGRITVTRLRPGPVRRNVLRWLGVPPATRIHLDLIGSEVWRLIDGTRTVAQIRDLLATRFPEESDLNKRLGAFFSTMVSRGLVTLGSASGSDFA